MESHGTFIVIDGTDGSGKATQTTLLVDRLRRENRRVETISFPQYGTKSSGMVEEYLSGKYGSAEEVGAERASIFYAVDRFDASKKIQNWLDEGAVVVSDRYVGSNMGHQGSKIQDPEKRRAFFTWNTHLEHELFQIPRPTVNIVLHVPTEIAMKRTAGRISKHGLTKDIHEADQHHLQAAEAAYIDLTKQFPEFKLVECVDPDHELTPEEVHERVWNVISPLLP